ncbi:MAG: hypothetical protein ACHQX1_00365 [Candidatus Micrarchaeales archaeon]
MEINETAKRIIKDGSIKVSLKRAGMRQFQIFTIKRIKLGNESFVELFLDKVIDISELKRLTNELGLPIEVENGRAFPDGLSAKDFVGL